MCEIELLKKCFCCKTNTVFQFSGSGTKGICTVCGYELPKNIHYNEVD